MTYVGPEHGGLRPGVHGVVVSDVHGPMDVRPYATPPTVPEEDRQVEITVRWSDGSLRTVLLHEMEPRAA